MMWLLLVPPSAGAKADRVAVALDYARNRHDSVEPGDRAGWRYLVDRLEGRNGPGFPEVAFGPTIDPGDPRPDMVHTPRCYVSVLTDDPESFVDGGFYALRDRKAVRLSGDLRPYHAWEARPGLWRYDLVWELLEPGGEPKGDLLCIVGFRGEITVMDEVLVYPDRK